MKPGGAQSDSSSTLHLHSHNTPVPVTVTNFKPTRIRSAYERGPRVQLSFSGEGRTKQSFKDECDINRIMARYMATGVLEHTREQVQGQFADVTALDFQEAMDVVANARSAFEQLPAAVRDRFENEPAKLLEFVHNPENLAESIELGFVREDGLSTGLQERLAAARTARREGQAAPAAPGAPGGGAAPSKSGSSPSSSGAA